MKDAIDACESAINIYPYAADPYALEVEIFLLIGHMDTAKRVVEKYRSLGIPSDRITYSEALILKNRRGSTGTVYLNWLAEYTSFTSYEANRDEDDY